MKVKATAGEAGEMNILVVCDGDFLWSETTHPQMGIMVMKNKPDARQMQTGDSEEFRTKYNLKVVGEEEFDGQPMWVLEGTLKAPAAADKAAAPGASDPEKARLSIGKKDNYLHRVRGYDKTGAEVADMQMTNIKVNGALAPALFKYTPPADAKVMDMTKGMPSMGGAPKGE
jgi:outer membrane lipoprotein-sorting protein